MDKRVASNQTFSKNDLSEPGKKARSIWAVDEQIEECSQRILERQESREIGN